MRPTFARGALAVLGAVILWGAQFPVAKSALATIDPFSLSAIRYLLAAAILAAWMAAREGRSAFRPRGRAGLVAFLGLVGMTASPMLVFGGLAFTRPEHVAIIVALQPSMTALADWVVRRRRPANFTLACIAVAFFGVITVVTKGEYRVTAGRQELIGDLMALAGAMCWVVYTMGTEAFRGWPSLKFTLLTLIAGAAGLVIGTALLDASGVVDLPDAAAVLGVWPQIAFLALGGVLAAMILWNWGNNAIGALNTMLLLNLLPVVTFAIGFARGARFSAAELTGVALVVGALAANNAYLRAKRSSAARSTSADPAR
ncbi:MAG: DMT family transporter [Burkholderiales bacterium]|jgi:drug/metabolite transporter (DMT)-like permease|nr:DMT family transporter [Burkholderiales bacterium]